MSNLNFQLQQISRWDAELCAFCNRRSRNFTVRNFFRLASRLGDGVFWYMLMAVLLIQYQAAALPAVLHMIVVGLVGTALYKFIKGKTLDQFSFPSGHTMHAAAFSIVVLAYYPGLFWLVVPFAVLVALSRPILGLHYPSDVLAGAALGAAIAGISLTL